MDSNDRSADDESAKGTSKKHSDPRYSLSCAATRPPFFVCGELA